MVYKNVNIEEGTKTKFSLPVDICKRCRISFQMIYTYPIMESKSYVNLHVLKFDSFVLDF